MSTTNILDLNNRVNALEKAVSGGDSAFDVAYDNTVSGLTATNVQGAVDEVVGKMGNMRMTKLWENPNPSGAFAVQDITGLSMSGYDFFAVITPAGTCIFHATQQGIMCISGSSDNANYVFRRTFTPNVNQNIVTVTDCVGTKIIDSSQATFNRVMIPYQIYGIKLI